MIGKNEGFSFLHFFLSLIVFLNVLAFLLLLLIFEMPCLFFYHITLTF